jgi:exosortase/archaeosortase family protein
VAGFLLRFALAFALLEVLIFAFLWKDPVFLPYARVNARLTAALLSPWVEGIVASGASLAAPGNAILVRPGCDSFQASAVLLAGIAAFPAPLQKKLAGAGIGLVLLLGLNLLRLGAILLTGIHRPELFDAMHLEILPGVFMVSALTLWMAWALWARAPHAVQPDGAGGPQLS